MSEYSARSQQLAEQLRQKALRNLGRTPPKASNERPSKPTSASSAKDGSTRKK